MTGALLSLSLLSSRALSQSICSHDTRALARILRIEDTRRDEPAFVDSLLTGPPSILRVRAALAAARTGARGHIRLLRLRTADHDSAAAATAWFALGLLHDSAFAPQAGAALHAAPTVAAEAARFPGDIGDWGRTGVRVGLADTSLSSSVREALLLSAARLRPAPAVAVAPLVSSPDSAVAWRAAYALARSRSAAGMRALLGAAHSPVAAVREQVARGLARSAAGDSLRDSARAELRFLVADPVPHVRVNAIRSLASYGTSEREEVTAAMRDRDAGVRLAAAQSLAAVLDSRAALAWTSAFDSDTALVVQRAVAEGARTHGVTLIGTQRWISAKEWRRRAAAAALDGIGSVDSAARRLAVWLADRDPRVRAIAASGLAALTDSTAVSDLVQADLRRMVSDADPYVRAAALGGLAAHASTEDLALALDAYSRNLDDRHLDARLAFWQLADSALAHADGRVPDSLSGTLAGLPRPADALERIAAARIPRFVAWADSSITPRPIEWYEARVREACRHPERSARITTDRGTMQLTLFSWDAPLTVHNFASLSSRHYFDGQRFHRVVPDFVVQGGDPRGDGNGGPPSTIRDEINRHRYGRGTLGMALSGPNTGGSQFFVTHSPQPHLDGGYTVFGQLRSGADVLDRIVQGDRIVSIRVQ